MAKLNPAQSNAINPTYLFSIISLATGIFGWVLGIFIMLTGFTPLSTYFPFGRTVGLFLILSPGFSWLTGIITGIIGGGQIKRKGHQQRRLRVGSFWRLNIFHWRSISVRICISLSIRSNRRRITDEQKSIPRRHMQRLKLA